jgi:predicted 3-demethylubiquinone-9 3-methyltransferase (glyoxalase superfamily)
MQKIAPFLWFDNQAQEAMRFYTSIFKNSEILSENPMSVVFRVEDQEIMGLNAGPEFKFNEAISFFVSCEDQAEVDEYWNKLIADGGEESRCGWLKDKFGLSWQIIPKALGQMLGSEDREKANRAMQAMLKMSKIIVADLEKAYEGK